MGTGYKAALHDKITFGLFIIFFEAWNFTGYFFVKPFKGIDRSFELRGESRLI
jgi:hypothetical protein